MGVNEMPHYEYTLRYSRSFSAAHHIPGHATCGDTHGHTYKVDFVINICSMSPGRLPGGIVLDFSDLRSIVDSLDHRDLNKIQKQTSSGGPVFANPTAENIAEYLGDLVYKRLLRQATEMLWTQSISIRRVDVTVHEGEHSSITWSYIPE